MLRRLSQRLWRETNTIPVRIGLALLTSLVAGGLIILIWSLPQSSVEAQQRRMARTLDAVHAEIAEVLAINGAVLREASEQVGPMLAQGGSADAMRTVLRRLVEARRGAWKISVVDAAGSLRSTSEGRDADAAMRDRPYFKYFERGGTGLWLDGPLIGRLSGNPLIVLACRIARPDGGFGGVAIAVVPRERIVMHLQRLATATNATIELVGDDGAILAGAGERPASEASGAMRMLRRLDGLHAEVDVTAASPRGATMSLWWQAPAIVVLMLGAALKVGWLLRPIVRERRPDPDGSRRCSDQTITPSGLADGGRGGPGSIVHELNNLLTMIDISAEEARAADPANDRVRAAVETILTASRQSADLTRLLSGTDGAASPLRQGSSGGLVTLPVQSLAAGAVRVLLVEDNAISRAGIAQRLTALGATVAAAADADEAQRLFDEQFDAVVIDVVLPGAVDGIGLGEWLRERDPTIPIIFVSGVMSFHQPDLFAGGDLVGFVRKPIDWEELGAVLDGLLVTRRRPKMP